MDEDSSNNNLSLTKVYLMRHGTPSNIDSLDSQISLSSMALARKSGRRLASLGVEHIFCSPFLKTIQTAQCVAEGGNLGKIRVENGLAECLCAEYLDCEARNPLEKLESLETIGESLACPIDESYKSVMQPVYPERPPAMAERARETFEKLVSMWDGNLLFVTHASVIQSMSCRLSESIDPVEVVEVLVRPNGIYSVRKLSWGGERRLPSKSFVVNPRMSKILWPDCCMAENDSNEIKISKGFAYVEKNKKKSFESLKYDKSREGMFNSSSLLLYEGEKNVAESENMIMSSDIMVLFNSLVGENEDEVPINVAINYALYSGFILKEMPQKPVKRHEFSDWMSNNFVPIKNDQKKTKKFLHMFDSYETGYISKDALIRIFSLWGLKIDSKITTQVLKKINMNTSKINYVEFLTKIFAENNNLKKNNNDTYTDNNDVDNKNDNIKTIIPKKKQNPEEFEPIYKAICSIYKFLNKGVDHLTSQQICLISSLFFDHQLIISNNKHIPNTNGENQTFTFQHALTLLLDSGTPSNLPESVSEGFVQDLLKKTELQPPISAQFENWLGQLPVDFRTFNERNFSRGREKFDGRVERLTAVVDEKGIAG